ncbi:hypothetical protein SLEP1_g51320 [Rubroshorea leprosula]|uniref:Uncharacterized protein n=1 Tax=Rubroshorea leprosula TaxID=152421 RepID=A0AAV5M3L1_9ROSI|nr:hypothetical protein SLEP1_g51320 [Rubroshorea leprosula]
MLLGRLVCAMKEDFEVFFLTTVQLFSFSGNLKKIFFVF